MSKVDLPVDFSYTSSFQGYSGYKPKISREELRKFVLSGKVFADFKAEHPQISYDVYNKSLKKYGYPNDTYRLRQGRNKSMMEMYNAGASLEEIASAHGFSVGTCKQYLNNMGVSCSKLALLERDMDGIKSAIKSSATQKEFAEKMGIGQNIARKLIDQSETQTINRKSRENFQELKRSTIVAWKETYKTLENIVKHVPFSKKQVIKAFNIFGIKI